jgi:hypothetical protein
MNLIISINILHFKFKPILLIICICVFISPILLVLINLFLSNKKSFYLTATTTEALKANEIFIELHHKNFLRHNIRNINSPNVHIKTQIQLAAWHNFIYIYIYVRPSNEKTNIAWYFSHILDYVTKNKIF